MSVLEMLWLNDEGYKRFVELNLDPVKVKEYLAQKELYDYISGSTYNRDTPVDTPDEEYTQERLIFFI